MSTEFINDQWRLVNQENKDKLSNYSMDFDSASSDYINVGNDVSLQFSSSFSISAWVKIDLNDTTTNAIISKDSNSSNGSGYHIDFRSGNQVHAWSYISSSKLIATGLTTNTWYHIVFVFESTGASNGNQSLYINAGTPVTNTITNFAASTVKHLRIGGSEVLSGYTNGQIDAVSIYNYALSSSQVTTLYGSSSTGIGNPMTLNPVAYYPLGDQDAFNGSNYLVPNSSLKDYVFDFIPNDNISFGNAIGNLIGDNYTGGFTISFWMNPDTTSGEDGIFNFSTNEMSLVLRSNSIRLYNNGQKASISYTNPNNEWSNCVLSFLPSGSVFYLDGVSVANWTYTDLDLNGLDFSIGWYAATNYAYDGKLSNFQIWNTNLSSTEAETIYNNGSPYIGTQPQNSNLIAWYKLDASATYDGSNWTIPDDSTNSNTGTSSGMTQANLVQSDLSFTSSYSPYALDFDSASSDEIDIPTITLANDFTISAWVTNTVSGSGSDQLISAGSGFFLFSTAVRNGGATAGKMTYYNGSSLIAFTDVIRDDNWHHVSLTYNSSTTTLTGYTDGNQTYSATYDAGTNNQINKIGDNLYSHNWLGKISNLSIWNAALTSAQVTEIYNEGVPSNLNNHSAYSNLVSWWQLGSNSSFNSTLNQWTCIDEKGTNTGESSQTFNEDAIVDGVGSYANGLSSGMGGDEVIGDAPYSTANSLSVNMDVLDRVTDTPS